MNRFKLGATISAALALALPALLAAAPAPNPPEKKAEGDQEKSTGGGVFQPFKAESVTTNGNVTIGGQSIASQAVGGSRIIHPKDWDDVPRDPKAEHAPPGGGEEGGEARNPTAEASMFYVAYFKNGGANRPVTFVYNGGPGSATVWLHMGAFGPKRIVTPTDPHTPAAPYTLTNNASSLLDATDLVFIDAPGTGFSRIAGKDKEKSFYGVDPDAGAFATFIQEFLSKYNRWNSPKYLFGESYGTPRAPGVINDLETTRAIDVNGVILLSAILNFDLSVDGPETNPGMDLPYAIALPTYAATAWYHHKIPGQKPKDLVPFVQSVERFAMGDYLQALTAGARLSPARRVDIANNLHAVTGLPVWYILKADLRINGGEFEKSLQDSNGMTTGRLDTRFSGPTIDPLSKEADYDPQSAAISSAYVSAFNEYVRKTLKFGSKMIYKEGIDVEKNWDY